MKIFKIIVITVLVLTVVTVIGLFIFLKTLDINHFKAKITEQISNALGRDVGIRHMAFTLSLRKGLALSIDGLSIKDDPAFSNENFFEVEHVFLGVNVLSFLKSKQISVSGIQIRSPKVILIRNEEGEWNVQKFEKRSSSPHPETSSQPAGSSDEDKGSVLYKLPVLLINSLIMENGMLVYVDRFLQPAVKAEVSQVDLKILNFSLLHPADLLIAAAVFSDQQNFKATGKVQIDPRNHQGRLDDAKIHFDLGQVSLDRLAMVSSSLKILDMVETLKGVFQAEIAPMIVGAEGISVLTAKGQLSDGSVKLADFTRPIDNIRMAFEATESDCNINNFSLSAGGGSITGSGRISDYLKKQAYSLNAAVQKLRLEEFLVGRELPVKMQGEVEGKFEVDGQGFDPEGLLSRMTGDGNLKINDGRVLNFNLLRSLLSKISLIPNIVEDVQANLPEKYKDVLNEKDTYLRKVEFWAKIEEGEVRLTRAGIETDGFLVSGRGAYRLDQTVSFAGSLTIPQDLSESMGTSVPELKLLYDAQGQIYIPIKPYEGPISRARVFPDMEYMGKRILANKGQEQIEQLINKALGGDEEGQDGQNSEQKIPVDREMIKGVLDSIFGK